ncbi:hypothetical protein C8J57DRAFT_1336192 [Mycena rebaudengoi]|nr:hypothetical protein C8J57DRAFT_1336192 [Mycena rebaudengoi]
MPPFAIGFFSCSCVCPYFSLLAPSLYILYLLALASRYYLIVVRYSLHPTLFFFFLSCIYCTYATRAAVNARI